MPEDEAMKVFFEIHNDIPRGGPGGFESTRSAFLMLIGLAKQPIILDVDANLRVIDRSGYRPAGHFTFPKSDRWDHYYTPIQAKLTALKKKYDGNRDAFSVVKMAEREIDFYRQHADYYGYVFYIMKTP